MIAADDGRLAPSDVDPEFTQFRNATNIKNIVLLGRRGMIQCSFTTKELREMTKLHGVKCYVIKEEIENSMNDVSMAECSVAGHGVDMHQVDKILNL